MSDCKHPMTSVTGTETVEKNGITFLVQYLTCVDCHTQCETSIT